MRRDVRQSRSLDGVDVRVPRGPGLSPSAGSLRAARRPAYLRPRRSAPPRGPGAAPDASGDEEPGCDVGLGAPHLVRTIPRCGWPDMASGAVVVFSPAVLDRSSQLATAEVRRASAAGSGASGDRGCRQELEPNAIAGLAVVQRAQRRRWNRSWRPTGLSVMASDAESLYPGIVSSSN